MIRGAFNLATGVAKAVLGTPEPADMTAEQASASLTVALVADLETWATASADADGRVGVLDLIQTLDILRESAIPLLPNYTEGSELT